MTTTRSIRYESRENLCKRKNFTFLCRCTFRVSFLFHLSNFLFFSTYFSHFLFPYQFTTMQRMMAQQKGKCAFAIDHCVLLQEEIKIAHHQLLCAADERKRKSLRNGAQGEESSHRPERQWSWREAFHDLSHACKRSWEEVEREMPKNSVHAPVEGKPKKSNSCRLALPLLFSNCFHTAGAFSSIVSTSSFSTRFLLAHSGHRRAFLSVSSISFTMVFFVPFPSNI